MALRKPEKRNKLFARFTCLNPQYRSVYQNGGYLSIRHVCGACVHCMRNNLNDLIAKVASHALICTHADFWTLSYNDALGVEQRVGAKIRVQRHAQNWQKILRERERRGILKYNAKELQAAEKQGREPELVDASRSYVKFITVPEIGDKGRCHFHSMVLWESHFPVPDDLIQSGDIRQTRVAARRVWNLPEIIGPFTERLPPDANNPEIIDFRVRTKIMKVTNGAPRKTGGNQLHGSWPHGFVNIQRMTHDVNQASGVPEPKDVSELADGIRYIQKYLKKWKNGADLSKEQKRYTDLDWQEFKEGLRKGVVRSHSRGLGHDFARVFGAQHANAGVPLRDLAFHLEGFNMKRSHASVTKLHMKLSDQSPMNREMLTQHRQTFLMRGAMADCAINEYTRILTMRGKSIEATDEIEVAKSRFRQVTQEFRKYMNSARASVARCHSKMLIEEIPACRMFDLDKNGLEMDGKKHEREAQIRPLQYRCAWERLKERQKQFSDCKEQYEAVLKSLADKGTIDRVKKEVGRLSLEDLLTEKMYKNRPKHLMDKFRRKFDIEHVENVLEEIEKQASLGNPQATEELAYIQQELILWQKEEFLLPRHDVWHELVHNSVLWKWINHSDDYFFPEIRDGLVAKYCETTQADGYQIIRSPDLRWFVRRKVLGTRKLFVWDADGPTHQSKTVQRQSLWASREITAEQIKDPPSLRSPHDRDAIFKGFEPLKPSWHL